MKKRWITIVTMILLCMGFSMSVFAQDGTTRMVDGADYLSDSEEKELAYMLDEISNRQDMDIVIVTVDSLDGKDVTASADDYYDENGYKSDGILFLIADLEREWAISTIGYGITAFTDKGQEYMADRFIPLLSEGNYAGAFEIFAQDCDKFIDQAKAGEPYDVGNMPKEPFHVGKRIVFALIVGFVIALIYASILKGQLKTVRAQVHASEYVKKDSMNITAKHEMFLYKHVDKQRKQTNSSGGSGGSSTHVSSSGRSHGGSRGKF